MTGAPLLPVRSLMPKAVCLPVEMELKVAGICGVVYGSAENLEH
jgi:hypothetical protein